MRRSAFLFLFILFLITGFELHAQLSYRVLFLGNSYTYTNNLPLLTHNVALSAGDTLIYDSYTPGGYQLEDHVVDVNALNKIMTGNWNYVVIQGQSQEPVVLSNQFMTGGIALNNLIRQYNPCAVTTTYMTWGRKNGDNATCPFFPVMCTYQGMDTTIRNRYMSLTENLNGEVSPVSVAWNYIRQNHPNIELYQPDESHPSLAGSYAAACCFYVALFKKSPLLITFDAGLSATDAMNIRNAVKTVFFDHLQDYDFGKLPVSDFYFQAGAVNNEIIFSPLNQNVLQSYLWDFGDGTTDTIPNPVHIFPGNGTYVVSLQTSNCDIQGLHTSITDTIIQFCSHTPSVYTNNPWICHYDTLFTQPADSYQWYVNGQAIPETGQFVSPYAVYGLSGFSVKSTINGCTELSQAFIDTPQWSGYYFDLTGNPCNGDTVLFAVLHINGLSGNENILWYKNDTLLTAFTDEDTLLITGGGKYECSVIDPNSNCPFDTTSYTITYNCDVTGIVQPIQNSSFSIYPNPATESVTIKFHILTLNEELEIYNSLGMLVKSLPVSDSSIHITVSDLPRGIYFVRMKNSGRHSVKMVKM